MKTSLEIINKLSDKEAVKLESQLVELNVYDQLKKEMQQANQGAIKAIDLAYSAIKPAETSLKQNKDLLVNMEDFIKKIKELGITSAQPEVEKAIVIVKENIKSISDMINALYKLK
jgi:cob(I)alamin adenosyltransferase